MGNIAETIIFEEMSAEDIEPIYVDGIPLTPDEHYEIVSNPAPDNDSGIEPFMKDIIPGFEGTGETIDEILNSIYIDSEKQKISQENLSNRSVNDEPK